MSTDDEKRARVGDALSDILGEDGEMVTRWLTIVETIDSDGERGMWSLVPDDTKPWDTLGMLNFAIQQEQAGAVHREDEP